MTRNLNQLSLLSFCLFLLLTVPLVMSLFFREQWLWVDEVLSCMLVNDPSLVHMNQAIVSGIDGNPPLFFNLLWLVGHGISANPLFLKSISVSLFSLTVVLFYCYTTRLVGRPSLTFVLCLGFVAFTHLNVLLATQMRTYSLYLLICLVFIHSAHRLVMSPANRRGVLWHVLLGFTLLMCHSFGLFYVGAVMGFFGLLWLWSGQRAYGWVTAAHGLSYGLWFICWFPQFTMQAQVGKPHSWIPVPTLLSFFQTTGELLPSLSSQLEYRPGLLWLPMARVLLVVALFLYIALPKLRAGWRAAVADPAFSFFLLSVVVSGASLLITLAVSVFHTSIFLSRYQWPTHLLLGYGLIYSFYQLAPQAQRRLRSWPRFGSLLRQNRSYQVLLAGYSLLMMGFIFYQSKKVRLFSSEILPYLTTLDRRYPIFFESPHYYLPIQFHGLANARYLLDWTSANTPGNLLNATNDHIIVNELRKRYNITTVVPVEQFLNTTEKNAQAATNGHFYVVDEASRYQFERLIRTHQVHVIRRIPVNIAGHQILECNLVNQ